ncbi:hypothetical protein LTR02_002338 [Friedmanniomyces endolithicus]|nr:hypothetical protein LTR94_000351 [Friedmanniomyces endolithicus]KAK0813168.1 hypothetical protein LTR75_004690 [Friedmanniomyces endolithicus]KAK0814866.1 hypothetical protein LTR59_000621 [Friedmanniomyces endolithicus]KAK0820358.1 hypothetical protein LTR38_000267 [Friedmanniomyces endolithicus]KAK0840071.1 hypothetical protein LTR03_010863 [Friedmanniomyces endolithicus]
MSAMFSKAPWTGVFASHDQPSQDQKGEEEGESLITILKTAEERSALTLLVADCTESMRRSITDIFDAKQTGKKSDMTADLNGDQALIDRSVNPSTVDVAQQDKMKRELEQREKELSGAKMQELKEAALSFFDAWRDSVLSRVGEILNSKEKALHQKDQAKPRPASPTKSASSRQRPNPPQYDAGVGETMRQLYPPMKNPLQRLTEDKRALILHSVFLLLLSLEHYHAYSRTLLLYLTNSLDLDISFLAQDESKVARGLLTAAENMKADEETKKKAEASHDHRKWKVGLATVAGAALIGVTGGLAAPLIAAGVGTMMGGLGLGATAAAGYLGTLAGSTVLVGGLFGAYGGRMTGKMMDQYAREVEDFAFIPVRNHSKPRKIEKEYRRLRVAIGISGWLTGKDDVVEPWKVIGTEMETFALRWELEALMNLGNSMTIMVTSAAWGYAKSEIIKRTVFASLTAGLWPLGLLKISRVIDNPWSVASYRAQKAGEVLADALINKAQGERPVTLIGYSLGARVIYTCLQSLAERKAFGLIESVVLIGAPAPSTSADWRKIRTVVSGRVVNVFSVNDYILAFLYRSSSIQFGVAGLQAVENVKGVENVDVSDLVSGHTSYRFLTGTILQKIGFEDVDAYELEKEQAERKAEEAKQEQELKKSEKHVEANQPPTQAMSDTKLDEVPSTVKNALPGSTSTPEVSEQQVDDMQAEIEKKNQQSYMGYAQEHLMSAGTSASVAYEKAMSQWKMRKQGSGVGKAAAAGADTPGEGDEGYQAIKARSEARKAGSSEMPRESLV